MAFQGFVPETLTFYAGLEADNTRPYWLAHKPFYDEHVRGAMLALGEALGDRFQPVHSFRPNRDVRLSKDKSLYKTQCGAVHEREGGSINYVAISARGLFVGTGMYLLAKDQLARFRDAVADDRQGSAFVDAVRAVRGARLDIGGGAEPPLKRAPKGVAVDHPRIEWLRWKGAIASKDFGAPAWLHTPKVVGRIREVWDAAEPLNRWLESNVGPSNEAPPDAEAF